LPINCHFRGCEARCSGSPCKLRYIRIRPFYLYDRPIAWVASCQLFLNDDDDDANDGTHIFYHTVGLHIRQTSSTQLHGESSSHRIIIESMLANIKQIFHFASSFRSNIFCKIYHIFSLSWRPESFVRRFLQVSLMYSWERWTSTCQYQSSQRGSSSQNYFP